MQTGSDPVLSMKSIILLQLWSSLCVLLVIQLLVSRKCLARVLKVDILIIVTVDVRLTVVSLKRSPSDFQGIKTPLLSFSTTTVTIFCAAFALTIKKSS
ncbi:hypothetical protein BOTCAL_0088g00100 [Botryotinia calthae]|uniref:Uncharacterized protein n=1 Tax=Botryotinia calthae TaxID=38488 RepID=A0A4Y8D9L3_9HELO|nr:hypothetical protein BOTCAL_0088g00100 [Botryotinia calthae]